MGPWMLQMILDRSETQRLGTESSQPVLQFREADKADGAWMGTRLLTVGDSPAFELSYWCGTCRFLFERLDSVSQPIVRSRDFDKQLANGLSHVDDAIVQEFSSLLPSSEYLPMLLEMSPTLVNPAASDDYFSHEQLRTYWAPAHDPGTPYYRSFESPISDTAHLYEFVVPMVPPAWNDERRVQSYVRAFESGVTPTAVAVSVLDMAAPAVTEESDWYEHWALTHFLLDGHHKMAAAARVGMPLTVLSVMATRDGLAPPDRIADALRARNGEFKAR
jgi:hypothetical protein